MKVLVGGFQPNIMYIFFLGHEYYVLYIQERAVMICHVNWYLASKACTLFFLVNVKACTLCLDFLRQANLQAY